MLIFTKQELICFVAFLNLGFLTWTYYDLKTLTCVIHEHSIFPKTYIKESRWRFAYHDCSHHPGATNTSLVAHVCVHTCALTHTPSSALKELRTLHDFSGLGLESRHLFCEHCQGRHCCEHPTGSIEWRPSLPRWQRNNGLTKRSVTRKVNFKDTIFRSFSKVHMGFHTLDWGSWG